MKKTRLINSIAALATIAVFSCKDNPELTDNASINNWIYGRMSNEYLYYTDIPSRRDVNFEAKPDEFFYSLLSSREKRNTNTFLSTIEEKTQTQTKSFGDSQDWYGMQFQLWWILGGGQTSIVASVLYVQEGSPAYLSGIRRGDIIAKVDNEPVSTSNYKKLLLGGERQIQRFKRSDASSSVLVFRDEITLSASATINEKPIQASAIIDLGNGKKVGYVCYVTFLTGPAGFEDKTYENEFISLINGFKAQGITDLVVDLRYNGGGYIDECVQLASLMMPNSYFGALFAYSKTNAKINRRNDYYFSNSLGIKAANLNLQRLFVLTSNRTASASELLINGLRPFMDVTIIGGTTVGKNIGSYEMSDSKYNWVMSPISLQIYNSKDFTDYASGFTPESNNLYKEDIYLEPLGSVTEPLLELALNKIQGISLKSILNTGTKGQNLIYLQSISSLDHKRSEMIEVNE